MEFFDKLPVKFMDDYERNLKKHVFDCWSSDELIVYMIGGNHRLSQFLAKWMVHCDYVGVALDDNNQEIQSDDFYTPYVFDDIDITLGDHHKLTRGQVKINIKECMEYITANTNWDVVQNNPFVKKYWEYIEMLAIADEAVCLLDLKDDGE